MMESNSATLERLAEALERDAKELDLARRQNKKAQQLWERDCNIAIHAMKQCFAAGDLGVGLFAPWFPGKSVVNVDRDSDRELLWYWNLFAIAWLRSAAPEEFGGNAGAYDSPELKSNSDGRIIGRDGKPLERVRRTDPQTGKEILTISAEPATELDDGHEEDDLSFLRNKDRVWADACRAAAKFIRLALSSDLESSSASSKRDQVRDHPRRPSVNARMLETIQKSPDTLGWNCRQWAAHLKCSKSSVVETATWKDLKLRREREKAERATDRRRKPKKK